MTNNSALTILNTAVDYEKEENYSNSFYPEPFFEQDGCLFIRGNYGDRQLCNFTPFIEEELVVTNGNTEIRYLKIGAYHKKGYSLKSVTLSISEFKKMNWIEENWGSACNVAAGNSNREQLRFAIQSTAEDILIKKYYSHIGWIYTNKCEYIMPNNSKYLGEDRVVSKYGLLENTDKKSSIYTLFLLYSEVAPKEIIYPLVAMMFTSPLIEFFDRAKFNMKTVLALIGQTGSKKSTLVALVLSHFENFTHDSLPLTFRDTANSILERLFALKDVPTVIDDFHPSTKAEENEMTKTAQLLLRAFGDRTARGRMKSDLSIAEPKPPRGSGIITAEMPPAVSESGTARYLSLEISQSDVNLESLSELQTMAELGYFQKSMYGYIEYLKENYLVNHYAFCEKLKEQIKSYRKYFKKVLPNSHDRIPEALSYLSVGFYYLCDYFIKTQVDTKESIELLKSDFNVTLVKIGENQNEKVQTDKPHIKFLQKLNSLIASGNLFFPIKTNCELPRVAIAGYQDENFYYLIIDTCHKAVKKLCEEQGESFNATSKQLLNALDKNGFIEIGKDKRRTRPINVNGTSVRVAYLKKDKFKEFIDTYL